MSVYKSQQADVISLMAKPVDFTAYDVPKLPPLPAGRNNDPLPVQAMRQLFELVPPDVEPPYPQEPLAVKTVLLPPIKEIIVVQRIAYEPSLAGRYEQARRQIEAALLAMRRWETMNRWFNLQNIEKRLGVKPAGS